MPSESISDAPRRVDDSAVPADVVSPAPSAGWSEKCRPAVACRSRESRKSSPLYFLYSGLRRLSKNTGYFVHGKEECVREIQEGFSALLKLLDFQNFLKF